MPVTMVKSDRVAGKTAALAQIDAELTWLLAEARAAGDVPDRERARARIDVLLERRHKISGRRTDAAEGSSPAGAPRNPT